MGRGVPPPLQPPRLCGPSLLENGHQSRSFVPLVAGLRMTKSLLVLWSTARPISTPRLNALLRLHLGPINLVVYQGSTSSCDDERSLLRVGFALICLQHLSHVDIATQLRAPGGTTGTPAVDFPGSSRTTGKSRQISNTCGG